MLAEMLSHLHMLTPRPPAFPTLRANPYPEVTDLFCRLPLPTFFYQLEAVHLGDLLRLSVRPDVIFNVRTGFLHQTQSLLFLPAPGFSWGVNSAPDNTKNRAAFPPNTPYRQLI